MLPTTIRKSSRRAFTLLELLLAMILVAVIAATLASQLASGFKARTVGEQKVQTARSVELVMETLRTDLQCAMPPSGGLFAGTFVGTQQQIDNGIEADDLVFSSTAPSPIHSANGIAVGNGEIKQFELTCYQPNNSNDHVLVRRSLNNLLAPTGSAQEPADEEVLCRQVLGFTLQYWDGTQWDPSWDSTQQGSVTYQTVPQAVMVTLTLAMPQTDASGAPVVQSFTRIYQLPNFTQQTSSTGTTTGSSTGGAK